MNKHLMLTIPNATDEHVSALMGFLRGVSEWGLSLADLDEDFSDPDEKCSPEDEAADLRVARDALMQQMIKAENEANDLRDDNADLADENWELNQRVEALVAELAESELRASKFERHNLALQSANTALRTRTLKTRTDIPEVGETVDAIPEAVVKALPIGARFKDREGDVVQKWDARGMAWNVGSSLRHRSLRNDGPFTRIEDAAVTDA